jgi:hypothetical protein
VQEVVVAREKKAARPRQDSPLQFRAGPELGRLVAAFAARHGLEANEACKSLVGLAVVELDCRFYGLLAQLAQALGGANAFVRACTHVQAALAGAGRVRGRPLQFDPERALFILQTVREEVAAAGAAVDEAGLWFLPEESPQEPARARQRGQRPVHEPVQQTLRGGPEAAGHAPEEDEEEAAPEPQRQPQRVGN